MPNQTLTIMGMIVLPTLFFLLGWFMRHQEKSQADQKAMTERERSMAARDAATEAKYKELQSTIDTMLKRQDELSRQFESRMIEALKQEAVDAREAGKKDGAIEELSKSISRLSEQMTVGFNGVKGEFNQVWEAINGMRGAAQGKKGGEAV